MTTSSSPFPPNFSRNIPKSRSRSGTSRRSHFRINSFTIATRRAWSPPCPGSGAVWESRACTIAAATCDVPFPRTPRSNAQYRKSASTGSPTNVS